MTEPYEWAYWRRKHQYLQVKLRANVFAAKVALILGVCSASVLPWYFCAGAFLAGVWWLWRWAKKRQKGPPPKRG